MPCPCRAVSRWFTHVVPCPSWKSACNRKNRTVHRETPPDSRKKPNLLRSLTGSTADVKSHISCGSLAVLCRDVEKSLTKRHGRSTALYMWIKHGRPVLFKWNRHDLNLQKHGTAGARHCMCELAFRDTGTILTFSRNDCVKSGKMIGTSRVLIW